MANLELLLTTAASIEASHGMMDANNNKGNAKKVKLSLQQAVEAHRVVRRRSSHIY
jgi:hypothetical protein